MIPENNAKNSTFYRPTSAQMVRIFRIAGLNVRVGSIDPADQVAQKIIELRDDTITAIKPVVRKRRTWA